jgi:hypothetical protein
MDRPGDYLDFPRTYPEQFGQAIEAHPTGATNVPFARQALEGDTSQIGIDYLAHLKNALAEIGPEFQSVPDEVLGRWLKQYTRRGLFGGNDTYPRGMPWDPANRRIQAGVNRAGF